jgi:hypothetical protein
MSSPTLLLPAAALLDAFARFYHHQQQALKEVAFTTGMRIFMKKLWCPYRRSVQHDPVH